MKRTFLAGLVCLGLLQFVAMSLAGNPPAAPNQATAEPSNTSRRAIYIQCNGSQLSPLIPEDVVRERAKQVAPKFELAADDLTNWLDFDASQFGTAASSIDVIVRMPDGSKFKAGAVMDALTEGLGKQIEKAYVDDQRDDERRIRAHHQELENKVAATTQRSADLKRQIAGLTERVNNNDDSIHAAAAKLEDELQSLELDVLSKTERRKAIEDELAKQSVVIDTKVAGDPIVAELQKVVDARQSALDLVKKQDEKGLVTPKDESDAIAALAEARAKLLERKRQAAIDAGGDLLQTFNRDLLTLSIDLRELKVRKEFVEDHAVRLRDASALLDQLHQAQNDAITAENDLSSEKMMLGGRDPEAPAPPPAAVRVLIQ